MKEKTERDLRTLIGFWDQAFALSEEEKAEARSGGEEGWKEMAPSGKLLHAAASLGSAKKVLDYGCGSAWAGIAAAKNGCRDVTAADAAPSAVKTARFYAGLYGVEDRVKVCLAGEDWLRSVPDGTYDGVICSNVIDVVPPETAGEILREIARITARDAGVIVGMNYYLSPEDAAGRGIALDCGGQMYVNGVLRLVSRTDGEWEKIFSPWYRVEKLEHFAWPGEKEERRRLFFLRRRRDEGGPLRLRPYKECDAAAVVSWIGDEVSFRKWSADRFASWPITPEDLNRHYAEAAGSDSFYEMTAFDGSGPAGHLIMRFTDEEKKTLRFGFVIVDSKKRGRGLGREMLEMAVRYAFEFLKAEKITLGVFENNEPARRCYRAAGFREAPAEKTGIFHIMGEDWKCLEMEMDAPEGKA